MKYHYLESKSLYSHFNHNLSHSDFSNPMRKFHPHPMMIMSHSSNLYFSLHSIFIYINLTDIFFLLFISNKSPVYTFHHVSFYHQNPFLSFTIEYGITISSSPHSRLFSNHFISFNHYRWIIISLVCENSQSICMSFTLSFQ